jgi:hypothetical protein
MATYGIKTYKSDGSTVVFQNSAKSGVFARTYTCTPSDITSYNSSTGVYRKEFPEYNGRTLIAFQLKPGNSDPIVGKTQTGLNVIEFGIASPSSLFTDARFTASNTVVYLFIK